MHSEFQELNAYAYHSIRGALLDLVIWCLGPYVDDSREYGLFRLCLAVVTRRLCRVWLQYRGIISDPV